MRTGRGQMGSVAVHVPRKVHDDFGGVDFWCAAAGTSIDISYSSSNFVFF